MLNLNKIDKKTLDAILVLALVGLVASLIIGLFWASSEGKECLSDALGYGVNKVAQATGKDITCTCGAINSNPLIFSSNLSKP